MNDCVHIPPQMEQLILPSLNLGPETTKQFATGLFTMPKLRSLDLSDIGFDDSFFFVMSEIGHGSQVRQQH